MTEEEEEILAKNSQVENFLEKNDKASALIICLSNPPINSKSEDIKVEINHTNFNVIICN